MEPLKPAERERILRNSSNATAADYEEYERLLALHFSKDPARQTGASDPAALRLEELRKKLFKKP
jgi:hypothetical protein